MTWDSTKGSFVDEFIIERRFGRYIKLLRYIGLTLFR